VRLDVARQRALRGAKPMTETIGLCAVCLVAGLLLGFMVCHGPNVRALRRAWHNGFTEGQRSRVSKWERVS